jgi:hypothetical protein
LLQQLLPLPLRHLLLLAQLLHAPLVLELPVALNLLVIDVLYRKQGRKATY